MLQNIKKIVVVAGCQRSGTTLVGQILGAHSVALLIDEPDGLYAWFDAFAANDPGAEALLNGRLAAINRKYIAQAERIKLDSAGRLAISPDVTHLVLKAPNLTYRYEDIARLPLPASVVFPVRDPRAVVASMMKLDHIPMVKNQLRLLKQHGRLTAELRDEIALLEDASVPLHIKCTLIWRVKTCLCTRFVDAGVPTHIFRYEDLVTDRVPIVSRLAEHVGLAFEDGMLAHQTVYQGFGPGYTDRARPVDLRGLERWSLRLTEGQEKDILQAAGVAMYRFGYGPTEQIRAPAVSRGVSEATLRSPIILAGRGGSGTRIVSRIAEDAGVFLGNRLNATRDSVEWVELIYEMAIRKASGDSPAVSETGDKRERLLLATAKDILSSGNWAPGQSWGWKLPESMIVLPELLHA